MRKFMVRGMYKEEHLGNEYRVPIKLTRRNKQVHLDRKLTTAALCHIPYVFPPVASI